MLGEQPVKPGDADVVQPIDRVAHDLGRDGRFFRHRQVGGARAATTIVPVPGGSV